MRGGKRLFARDSRAGYLLTGLLLSSAVLLAIDTATQRLKAVRGVMDNLVVPLFVIAELPYMAAAAVGETVASRSALLERIGQLEQSNLALSHQAQRFRALQAENDQLRRLLGSDARVASAVRIAEVVGVTPNPAVHQLVIDKGTEDGVRVGQAVVDAAGLIGQIVDTTTFSARVLLITDASHAVPVEVVRNNLRSIVGGTGRLDRLLLEGLPITTDIRPGDRIVTSGLGGRFPRGYPVGTVQSVVPDASRIVAVANVTPSALLDRTRHLLVILSNSEPP
ncbi:MAG: rod shape-determining protein MreC [Gammaproteobacteria bacterium]|nr:rod shape-determining protein MreC [Gammaproteobacteria bacterium]MYK83102.1 rod shape-determining protein MreC [Gammaproteobacteria bacterium]